MTPGSALFKMWPRSESEATDVKGRVQASSDVLPPLILQGLRREEIDDQKARPQRRAFFAS